MIDRIFSMLSDCDTMGRPVLPRTTLFNEGWLLRVALDWFEQHPDVTHELGLPEGVRWYGEALLPTRFKASRRGDTRAESRTHADAVVGYVGVGGEGIRDLHLESESTHFVVLEAKLRSGLSPGTRNAPEYDQAARTVACMAESIARCGPPTRPEQMSSLGFFVVAPEEQIRFRGMEEQLRRERILETVRRRVAQYEDAKYSRWLAEWFEPMLRQIRIGAVSWEGVAETISRHDPVEGKSFNEFYQRCLQANGLDERGRRVSSRRSADGGSR